MNGRYVKHRTQPPAKGTIGLVRAFQMERSFADQQIAENIMKTWENDLQNLFRRSPEGNMNLFSQSKPVKFW